MHRCPAGHALPWLRPEAGESRRGQPKRQAILGPDFRRNHSDHRCQSCSAPEGSRRSVILEALSLPKP